MDNEILEDALKFISDTMDRLSEQLETLVMKEKLDVHNDVDLARGAMFGMLSERLFEKFGVVACQEALGVDEWTKISEQIRKSTYGQKNI